MGGHPEGSPEKDQKLSEASIQLAVPHILLASLMEETGYRA